MTDDELKELRRLADAATPGPWYAGHSYEQGDPGTYVGQENDWRIIVCDDQEPRVEDAAFIAAAREAIPKLLDEIKRLRGSHCHGCNCKMNSCDDCEGVK